MTGHLLKGRKECLTGAKEVKSPLELSGLVLSMYASVLGYLGLGGLSCRRLETVPYV